MTDTGSEARQMLAVWRLDRVAADTMVGWVEMLRDDNRIHVDPQAAEALGYGLRTVNPGPANLAYVLNMLLEACPGGAPARIEARFLGNVLSDDAVEVTGERRADERVHAALRVVATGAVALEVDVTMRPTDA